MPGDLITASKRSSVAAAGGVVSMFTPVARADCASSALQNNVRGLPGKRLRNAASTALPSRPYPQTATRALASSARRTREILQPFRQEMFVCRQQQRRQGERLAIQL